MTLAALGTVFGIMFIGELPDKTMFASLVLAARGNAVLVWLGVATAFAVHVAIAVTVGGVLLTLLPHRVVQAVVALLFAVGAVMAVREDDDDTQIKDTGYRFAGLRTVATAFVVIFIAEWGDLTQVLAANLAARYGHPVEVGLASLAALWLVAGIAMVGGRLLRQLPVMVIRRVTAVMLFALAILAGYGAITGHSTLI
jgi:putative Ca2+/H+ antiporter (TMEM165/GDT1 family)